MATTGVAVAVEVGVVGLFPGKAVVVIGGGKPRTITVEAGAIEGVKLLAVEGETAVLEFDGKKHRIGIGQHVFSSGDNTQAAVIHLTADKQGHFVTLGSVNGASVRFLVDTGATLVSLGAADAARAGIDFRKGQPATHMTANGPIRVWHIKLTSIRVGDVLLYEVDGAVQEKDMPVALLGMSFLNRMEMKRDGQTMTLKKRF